MLSELVVGRSCMLMRVVMSLLMGVSIGPFDSEAFSFQEETKNTQGRTFLHIITTPGGLLELC